MAASRLHRWLAKPDNPAMSLHAPEKTGNCHTDNQWKVRGVGRCGVEKPLNAPHTMLLLPATLINKRYGPKQVVFHACSSIPKPLTTIGRGRSKLFNWLNFV